MRASINILDDVALTKHLLERGLYKGQVGTILETLALGVSEVEFSDEAGQAHVSLALETRQILVLSDELLESG